MVRREFLSILALLPTMRRTHRWTDRHTDFQHADIACDDNDDPPPHLVYVYCNGRHIKNAIMADVAQGWVKYWDDMGDVVFLYGRIQILFKNAESRRRYFEGR